MDKQTEMDRCMDIQTEIQSCLDCLIDLQKCANERNDLQDICAKQGPGNGGVPLFFNVIKPIVLPMTQDGLYQHISIYITHKNGVTSPYIIHISLIFVSPYITMTWGMNYEIFWGHSDNNHLWHVTGFTMNITNSSKTFMIPKGTNITNPYKSLLLNICIYIFIQT